MYKSNLRNELAERYAERAAEKLWIATLYIVGAATLLYFAAHYAAYLLVTHA